MKVITVHRLSLQFDANQITHGKTEQQLRQAVDLINLTLQRFGQVGVRKFTLAA